MAPTSDQLTTYLLNLSLIIIFGVTSLTLVFYFVDRYLLHKPGECSECKYFNYYGGGVHYDYYYTYPQCNLTNERIRSDGLVCLSFCNKDK